MQHKADIGALVLDVAYRGRRAEAHRRLAELGVDGARVLVERMAPPGTELLVAARADAVVPCLVVGAGGVWTEVLDDAAVVPLPATPERVEAAIRSLRAAASSPAAAAARRLTWAPPPGWPPQPASCCSRADSSCSS